MILTFNGFTINDGSTGAWLDVEINGLELPQIRTSTGNYAGKDGAWVGAQFFSGRDITVQGKVFSSNVSVLETSRAALQNALLGGPMQLNFTTNAGNQYVITANLLDFQMPIQRALWKAPFKIEWLASDPIIYQTNISDLTADITPVVGGGFTWPPTWPIVYQPGSAPLSVDNSGSVDVWPSIILTGSMMNPILTNNTSELFVGLNLTTGTSDQVVINMQSQTVTLDGANIYGDLIGSSTFWPLLVGSNSITLATSDPSDTVTGVISWQPGVLGI